MRSLHSDILSAVVGTADAVRMGASRRPLDGDDVRYIHQCRARGYGWQTIATQMRRNVTDVRIAAGDLRPDGMGPPEPVCHDPERPTLLPTSQLATTLLALARGVRDKDELAAAVGVDVARIGRVLRQLYVQKRMIDRHHALTAVGDAEVPKLKAAIAAWLAAADA